MYPDSHVIVVVIFTVVSFLIGNVGLTQIITLAIPMLMFLYPLAITLILLAFLSPLFGHRQMVYMVTTLFTLFAAFGDACNAMPQGIHEAAWLQQILLFYKQFLPFFDMGMGWIVPACAGFILGIILAKLSNQPERTF